MSSVIVRTLQTLVSSSSERCLLQVTASSGWTSTATTASTGRPSPSCRTSTRLSRRLPRMAESRGNPYYLCFCHILCFIFFGPCHVPCAAMAWCVCCHYTGFAYLMFILCLRLLYCSSKKNNLNSLTSPAIIHHQDIYTICPLLRTSIHHTTTGCSNKWHKFWCLQDPVSAIICPVSWRHGSNM